VAGAAAEFPGSADGPASALEALVLQAERSGALAEAHSAVERPGSAAEPAQNAALSADAKGRTPKADAMATVVPQHLSAWALRLLEQMALPRRQASEQARIPRFPREWCREAQVKAGVSLPEPEYPATPRLRLPDLPLRRRPGNYLAQL